MATIGSAKATLVNKIDSLTSSATAKDTIFLAKALKENSSLNNFVWEGAWTTATAYATDDVVSNGGNTYMCVTAHTSGASFAVGSDWEIMAGAGADGTNGTDGTNVGTGNAGQILQTNAGGSAIEWADASASGGLMSVQTFESSGTWTKPADVSKVRVQVVGGGASGNHSGMGGGAGGYAELLIDVSSITSESVTVASPRSGNTAGQTSSFGSHCSGYGGQLGTNSDGGRGGEGSGNAGTIKITGGGGDYHDNGASGAGGSSYFGGGQHGLNSTFSGSTSTGVTATLMAYGSGGVGVYNGYTQGGTGVGGLVIVWEYA
jgi:hypothetical protein